MPFKDARGLFDGDSCLSEGFLRAFALEARGDLPSVSPFSVADTLFRIVLSLGDLEDFLRLPLLVADLGVVSSDRGDRLDILLDILADFLLCFVSEYH